jgi:hypothetical protein
MSRFIPHSDMSGYEIVRCSYDAMALVSLCASVAGDLSENDPHFAELTDGIKRCLSLATELMGLAHDTLEGHEGLTDAAKSTG